MANITENSTFKELHLEIERLTRELDQSIFENVQSGQCGLALLEEKCALQKKCAELESMYEMCKLEVDITKEALIKLQQSQKVTTENGIEQEDVLLNESAAMETSFTLQISEMQNEYKQLKKELEHANDEHDRLMEENFEILKEKSNLEADKNQLKSDLKELKSINTNLLKKCDELENENSKLAKEILNASSLQINFEATQKEIKQLMDENLCLKENLEEMVVCRKSSEAKMTEVLETLENEREVNSFLKKELEAYLCKQSIYKNKSLAESIMEVKGSDCSAYSSRASLAMDSKDMNILHRVFNELKNVEKKFDQIDGDRKKISKENENHDDNRNDLENLKINLKTLTANLNALIQFDKNITNEESNKANKDKLEEEQESDLKSNLTSLQNQLQNSVNDFMLTLQNELENLKDKLKTYDLTTKNEVSLNRIVETRENLMLTKQNLRKFSIELLQFYKEICSSNVVESSIKNNISDQESDNDSLGIRIQSQSYFSPEDVQLLVCSREIRKSMELASDNFKHLKMFVQQTIVPSKEDTCNNINGIIVVELLKKINKLEGLLTKKQKEIEMLKDIISLKREEEEKAFNNIRIKYEEEKRCVNETIFKLKSALKARQDESVVFSGLRSKFTERCAEYLRDVDDLTFELHSAQNEKKLLHRILEKLTQQSDSVGKIYTKDIHQNKKNVRFLIPSQKDYDK